MELLTYPKNEYLLDASLESLHAESSAWLKELDFWNDELAFFYKILHHKEIRNAFPAEEVAGMDQQLIRISSEEMVRVRSGVESHERLLISALKSGSMAEEQVYRETHRKLHREVYELGSMIRSFKKDVFAFYGEL